MVCYEPYVTRDDDIAAIVERGRQTRRSLPRGLWIAAAIVGAVCAAGFAIILLADPGPGPGPGPAAAHQAPGRSPGESVYKAPGTPGAPGAPGAPASWVRSGSHRAGLVTGLALGVVIGILLGIAIGRQRSHSSRRSP
jgi:hypothetical protein